MNGGNRTKRILGWLNQYLIFFLLVAFVITCCTMLFVSILSATLQITLSEADIAAAAKITFLNVVLIALIFTVLDSIRRRITVERPVKSITEAAERIVQGDFSVRVKPQGRFATDDTFARIIECFNQMAEELGGVETLRTDFIANVSHEMKTPLAVMQSYGRLLQAPDLTEEERIRYAKGVTDGARRMADMMENILKLNRLENQEIYPQLTEYDLGEQLCASLLQYESIWEEKGIELDTDIAEGVQIRADAELLGHVWSNLFSNAFKFTGEGGRVTVSLQADGKEATVRVSDTGCGMSCEVGAHIFEKFYQGDTSHSTQGNGLGLALVKRVIDIMQGEIGVESEVGRGSTFTVRIRRS